MADRFYPMNCFTPLIRIFLLCLFFLHVVPLSAQTGATASLDQKAIWTKIEGFKTVLNNTEKELSSGHLGDGELKKKRDAVTQIAGELSAITLEIDPKITALNQRLSQLEPSDDDKTAENDDNTEIKKERSNLQSSLSEIQELKKVTATLSVQAQQLLSTIAEQRRLIFTRSIFTYSHSVLSPILWQRLMTDLPEDLRVTGNLLQLWVVGVKNSILSWHIIPLFFGILIAFILIYFRKRYRRNWVGRDPDNLNPTARIRIFASFRLLFLDILFAISIFYVFSFLVNETQLFPPQLWATWEASVQAFMLFFIACSLNDAFIAPQKPQWGLISLSEKSVQSLYWLSQTLYMWIAVKIVIDAFYRTITASVSLTLVTNAIFALGTCLSLIPIMRFPKQEASSEGEAGNRTLSGISDKSDENSTPTHMAILKIAGWLILALVFLSLIVGYISFASFLIEEAGSILIVLGFASFALIFIDELIYGSFTKEEKLVRFVQDNTGIRKSSLEQISVISAGLLKLIIIIICISVLLARLRIDSVDIANPLKAAFFGFEIGALTVSLSSVMTSVVILVVGLLVTRIIRTWLDSTYFPVTNMDVGLRNSILTIFGYAGTAITILVACSSAGFSLDKIAILAGALSVGIGFGLQSIVNNFVSGLILLWERPIKVGDWVRVGTDEGYVRNINVRATEIQTFDRATVIVPNSNLISGTVINNVRLTRMRRIIIIIPLPLYTDADRASEIIRSSALAHIEVMSNPAANVTFKDITDTLIELQLVCFVDDVDAASRVSSELRFAIFRELRQAGFLPTAPSASKVLFQLDKGEKLT